jgi:hypothetical protein
MPIVVATRSAILSMPRPQAVLQQAIIGIVAITFASQTKSRHGFKGDRLNVIRKSVSQKGKSVKKTSIKVFQATQVKLVPVMEMRFV